MNTKLYYIENWLELAKQANWSVSKLAKNCNISSRTLERFFFKEMGKSPKVWLKEQRQKRAEELLMHGTSVKETATILGYKYAHHFSDEFKKIAGCCPTEFKPGTRSFDKRRVFV